MICLLWSNYCIYRQIVKLNRNANSLIHWITIAKINAQILSRKRSLQRYNLYNITNVNTNCALHGGPLVHIAPLFIHQAAGSQMIQLVQYHQFLHKLCTLVASWASCAHCPTFSRYSWLVSALHLGVLFLCTISLFLRHRFCLFLLSKRYEYIIR